VTATGGSYRDAVQRLVISDKTARHHSEHVYNKIAVFTRAAAAMFTSEVVFQARRKDLSRLTRRDSKRTRRVARSHPNRAARCCVR